MTGLDTNIIVRYLTQDDPIQSALATELIENHLRPESPGFISVIVLIEVSWTLKRAYNVGNDLLATILEKLLTTAELRVEYRDLCCQALQTYKKQKCDFADALIGLIHANHKCSTTLTFDKRASRLEGFSLLA